MSFWQGRRVLVTGHTGFKGGWLSLWLQWLGAEVSGLALAPSVQPSMFEEAKVGQGMASTLGDIRDPERPRQTIQEFQPEVVFHLAAQPLVRKSYSSPLETYATNVLGTASVLDAVRQVGSVRAVVAVTTDKCYENREWEWPYRESDPLGGYDPYSSSKACSELVVSAYRQSFFSPASYQRHGVGVASARAGNVIGGGDWSVDRLIPDVVSGFNQGRTVRIRNPQAVRPWQHVLEPLAGYLSLAQALYERGAECGEAWNFGPEQGDARTVEWIVREMAAMWGNGVSWELDSAPQPHEARYLKLDWSKAAFRLGWRPHLRLRKALELTIDWYRAQQEGKDMRAFTLGQIEGYEECRQAAVTGGQ